MSVAKVAKGADYYNHVFSTTPKYLCHYNDSPYCPMWRKAVELIRAAHDPCILEIGCGTGQFAHMLWDNGIRNYRGFDFSPVAIEMAQRRCPEVAFSVCDALEPDEYAGPYSIAVAMEVLEHIEDDLGVLDHIRCGTDVIFSVPTFDCESHVRTFPYPRDVACRYKGRVHLKNMLPFEFIMGAHGKQIRFWLCRGTKI